MGKTNSLSKTASTSKKATSTVSEKSRSIKEVTKDASKSAKKVKKQTAALAKEVATPAQLDKILAAIREKSNYTGNMLTNGMYKTLCGMTNGMNEEQIHKFIAADRRENPSFYAWIAAKRTPKETEAMVDEIIKFGRIEANYEARKTTVKAAGKKDAFKPDVRDALVSKFGTSGANVRNVLAGDRLKNPKLHTFFLTTPGKPQIKVTPDEKMAYEDSVIHARNEGEPIAAAFAIADVKLRLAELDPRPVNKKDTSHRDQLLKARTRLAKMAGEMSTADEGEGEEGVEEAEGVDDGEAEEADEADE